MVGVQDEQHVQRAHHLRVELVGFGGEAERHAQEVLDQRQRVVRVQERLSLGLLVGVGRDGRQLGQQPDRRQLDLLVVERIQRILVVGAQRVHGAGQHRHRVGVAREAVEEPLEVLVQQGVPLDLRGELLQLLLRRQLTVDEQVADLDERRLLGELLDGHAAVAQDAGIPVDVGDRRLRRGGVDEATVERRVSRLGQQRAQRDAVGPLGGLDDVELELATGVIEDGVLLGFGVIGHWNPFAVDQVYPEVTSLSSRGSLPTTTQVCLPKGSPIPAVTPAGGTGGVRRVAEAERSGRRSRCTSPRKRR